MTQALLTHLRSVFCTTMDLLLKICSGSTIAFCFTVRVHLSNFYSLYVKQLWDQLDFHLFTTYKTSAVEQHNIHSMKQAGHLKVTSFTPAQFLMHKQGRDQCHLHHLYMQPAREANVKKHQAKHHRCCGILHGNVCTQRSFHFKFLKF